MVQPSIHEPEVRPTTPDAPVDRRSKLRRFVWYALAVYFILYTFPFPLTALPWIGGLFGSLVEYAWDFLARGVGTQLLRLEDLPSLGFNGSGDRTFDYLLVPIRGAIALLSAAAGLWVGPRIQRPIPRAVLATWLEALVRYWLAFYLLVYGMMKVIPSQFSAPGLHRLLETYGDSSPMGLLWTFMGASASYTIFSGLAELAAGLLLVFRRTRTLGALVAAGVMTQVLMLNLSYDVPVKLFSAHLLVVALGLLWLDRRRLVAFFWTNAPAPPSAVRPLVASGRGRLALGITVAVLVVGNLADGALRSWGHYSDAGPGQERSEIWGIHDVASFSLDGQERPPLLTDEERWKTLVVDRAGSIHIQKMDGELVHHHVDLDQEADVLVVLPEGVRNLDQARRDDIQPRADLRYSRPAEGELLVEGTWGGREIEVRLRERDLESFELLGRGFRWINEYPYNR